MDNKPERKRLTRLNQLWALIILAAITTALQYALQGALATRADISTFPSYFWVTDYVFWAVRSLVEAWCIVYLFTTQASKRWYSIVLTCFEVGLIALITLTLGPALRSVGMGRTVEASLEEVYIGQYNAGIALFWLWNFGIAAYAPMMLASVGFAYRMQPTDNGHSLVDASQLQVYEQELRRLEGDATQARGEAARAQLALEQMQGEVASALRREEETQQQVAFALQDIAWMQQLEETTQARLLFLASGGNGLTPAYVAKVLGIAPSTSSRAKATMDQAVDAILAKREAEKGGKV